jgi:phosphoribosylamine--glycine ligase
MKVLLVGSGGREHALALKLLQSTNLSKLYCLPGNPGTEKIAKNINLNQVDYNSILNFCLAEKIDLVVIGPERPLVDGLSDILRSKGIKVFGPSAKAARIEASKYYAKEILDNAFVHTAAYKKFNKDNYEEALEYVASHSYPLVIKADGLAAGKGVIICSDISEANDTIEKIFINKIFGASGNKIVIEEFLEGEEASIFAITDGENFICLPAAQDHKRIGNKDTGKNTGGMGAYAPAPIINQSMLKRIENEIVAPTLRQMEKDGSKFIGCLYVGLMINETGPKVIEFNCRFGDPETQVVLPLLDGDLVQLFYTAASGNLDNTAVKYSGGCAVCIVAASGGYPDEYEKEKEISGLDEVDPEIIIYHAGTKNIDNKLVTDGGRVLGVTSVIKDYDLRKAQGKAYDAVKKIHFDGIYYRKDIGDKAFKHSK